MTKKKFVIIAIPRSGSNLLCEQLRNHENYICNGELFHPDEIAAFLDKNLPFMDVKKRNQNPSIFLQDYYKHCEHNYPNKKAIGFKLLYSKPQIKLAYDLIMKDDSIYKIILSRKNLLASFSSQQIAASSGIWMTTKKSNQPHNKIFFDEKKFTGYAKNITKFSSVKKELESYKQKFLELDYHDVVNLNAVKLINDFLDFETLDEEIKNIQIKKQNSKHPIDRFSNPEAVKDYMKKIDKEHWLYD